MNNLARGNTNSSGRRFSHETGTTRYAVSDLRHATRSSIQKILTYSIAAHLICIGGLLVASGDINDLSRDSAQYHLGAIRKAARYQEGNIVWSMWIDEAWHEVLGTIYYIFGPQMILVSLFNTALAAFAGVLTYHIALEVFRSLAVARASGITFALFPSFVYYTSMPLKEALAVVGVLSVVYGTSGVVVRRTRWTYGPIVIGLCIMAGLRVYLVPILVGCVILSIMQSRLPRSGLIQVIVLGLCIVGGVLLFIRSYGIEVTEYEALQYYDLDNLNEVRRDLTRGNSRLYDNRREAAFDNDILANLTRVIKGLLSFILCVDITQLHRPKQLAATPEALFFLFCLSTLYAGIREGLRHFPKRFIPLLLFGGTVIIVYASATTNGGTMSRWRLQALPFLIMIIMFGASVRRRGLVYNYLRRLR